MFLTVPSRPILPHPVSEPHKQNECIEQPHSTRDVVSMFRRRALGSRVVVDTRLLDTIDPFESTMDHRANVVATLAHGTECYLRNRDGVVVEGP